MQQPRVTINTVRVEWLDDDDAPNRNGVHAYACVSYQMNETTTDRRTETLTSGGCWGISSDENGQYRASLVAEELADLREHLAVFGVTCSDAEWTTLTAELKAVR